MRTKTRIFKDGVDTGVRLCAVRDLKKGEYFRLDNSETAPVWIRGEYNRASKKYEAYKFDDICHSRIFWPDTDVYTGFTF